jgi:anti-sigma regulatory factor (Ser/Thr protein kinase)
MQSPNTARTNGRAPSAPRHTDQRAELDGLRATCRSQALAIEALGEAVSTLRRGAAALKAENTDLRAEHQRRSGHRGRARATGRPDGPAVAVRLTCDVRAPAAARSVVAQCLRGRVAADVLENAQLVVSELVTNGVLHSGACATDALVVRVALSRTMVRVEVEDPGRGGVIAPRSPDLTSGGGFGLQLVQALSERWGMERVTQGGTSVWAQLPRTPTAARASSDEPGERPVTRLPVTRLDQPAGGRQTPPGGQP